MKKFGLAFSASVAALSVLAAGIFSGGLIEASGEIVWDECAIESTYVYGEKFDVPPRKVTINGKEISAETTLLYPDGSAVRSSKISLGMSGRYTVIYTATADGKTYSDEISFDVLYGTATVGNEASSVTYGKYRYAKSDGGLMVRLAENDVLKFNQAIDVSDVTMSDVLVEAFATPDQKGTVDFERLYFTFTDSENPDVYMRVSARQSSEGYGYPITYYLAGGNGQPLTGYEVAWDRLHIDNEWGQQANHSFSLAFDANFTEKAPDEMKISLSYDGTENAVYVSKQQIIDFDNPDYFSTLWSGFPSGKVFLSISASMYSSTTANFCVSGVRGIDLTAETFSDDVAPEIDVDNGFDVMPAAKVGTPYKVPTATAKDLYSGDVEVKTSVWYNYGASNAVNVQLENGAFVPEKTGRYTIEYAAVDYSGNRAVTTLDVKAEKNLSAPVITIEGGYTTEALAGETVSIASYSLSGSDSAEVNIYAVYDGKTFSIDKTFRPENAGVYSICYSATDYIGLTSEISYDITVSANPTPLFLDEPDLPRTYISGCSYTLAGLEVSDFSGGSKQLKEAVVTVKDKNGARVISAGTSFIPEVENNGDEVTVTYSYGGEKLIRKVPCIIAWNTSGDRPRLLLENYFICENSTADANDDGMVITAESSENKWSFANSFLAQNFEVVLKGIDGSSKLDSITITFTDTADENLSVSVYICKNSLKSRITVCDTQIDLESWFSAGAKYEIGYADGNITIGNAKIPVSRYDNGEAFSGFGDGKIYLDVKASGASYNSAYLVESVNGHPMLSASTDRIAPVIVVYGEHGGMYNLGDTVVLPAAKASDVLDANSKLTVTVTDPEGNIVTDANGMKLNAVNAGVQYTLSLSRYGQYRVVLTAEDTFNNRINQSEYIYALNVVDRTAPQISFSGEMKDSAKVGDTVVIPSFTVSDNLTEAENITVVKYVLDPSGRLIELAENCNSFKVGSAGVYIVRILAYDERGNIEMKRFTVTVTE